MLKAIIYLFGASLMYVFLGEVRNKLNKNQNESVRVVSTILFWGFIPFAFLISNMDGWGWALWFSICYIIIDRAEKEGVTTTIRHNNGVSAEMKCLNCREGKLSVLDQDKIHGIVRCEKCRKSMIYQVEYGGGNYWLASCKNWNCQSSNLKIWEESRNSVITYCEDCRKISIYAFRPSGNTWKTTSQLYNGCSCGGGGLKISAEDLDYVTIVCKDCGARYSMKCNA